MRAFLFLGLALFSTAGSTAYAAPLPACRDAWSSLVRTNQHKFDYARGDSYSSWQSRTQRERCRKDWTVLVYMSADNDLMPYALWDLYEMEAGFQSTPSGAGSTIGNDLVVQLDSAGNSGLRRYHVFQTPEVYQQKQKTDFDSLDERSVRSPVVQTLSERDGNSEAKRFQEFLSWAVEKYPSERYMVVVWGHGRGWVTQQSPQSVRSLPRGSVLEESDLNEPDTEAAETLSGRLAFKQSSGDFLDIPSLRTALSQMARKTGKPIDVYASDACLMQMVEVASELAPHTRYIVGSAQIQSFLGLPYRRIMHELNTGRFGGLRASARGADESKLMARMIPKLFRESMHPRLGLQGRVDPQASLHLTSSSIESAKLRRTLSPALEALGKSLIDYISEDAMRSMDLMFVAQKTPGYEGGAQDLGVFLAHLQTLVTKEAETRGTRTSAAKKLGDAVTQAHLSLDATLVNYSVGTDYDRQNGPLASGKRRGVSVWLPGSAAAFNERRADFSQSSFYENNRSWIGWLDLLY
jgi:hypothetical protein